MKKRENRNHCNSILKYQRVDKDFSRGFNETEKEKTLLARRMLCACFFFSLQSIITEHSSKFKADPEACSFLVRSPASHRMKNRLKINERAKKGECKKGRKWSVKRTISLRAFLSFPHSHDNTAARSKKQRVVKRAPFDPRYPPTVTRTAPRGATH